MNWVRAGTSFWLCFYLDVRDSHRNPRSKSILKDGCFFPVSEGNQTQIPTQIKLIVSKDMLCFPTRFLTSFSHTLDLRNNCISLDFTSNDIYFIITSRLCFLLTSCQRSERLPTFPLWLRVHLSSTESRFLYAAGKLKISSYTYLFL